MEVDREEPNGEAALEPEPSKEVTDTDVKMEPAEDDEDPVVHEIPVFLSKGINKLFLFQVRNMYVHPSTLRLI